MVRVELAFVPGRPGGQFAALVWALAARALLGNFKLGHCRRLRAPTLQGPGKLGVKLRHTGPSESAPAAGTALRVTAAARVRGREPALAGRSRSLPRSGLHDKEIPVCVHWSARYGPSTTDYRTNPKLAFDRPTQTALHAVPETRAGDI